MKRTALLLLSATTILVLGHTVACGSKGSHAPAPVTGDDSNIIGGVDAKSASLNAVGAILYRDPTTQQLMPMCTATLIAPQTILTAKHCAVQFGSAASANDAGPQVTETRYLEALKEMYFAIGYDTKAPTKTVALDDVKLCNDYDGGWVGLGCDISTYHLRDAITDIKPLKVADAAISDASIGKKLTAIGYGTQNEPENILGTRKVGALTLRATAGAPLRVLFPTLDAFSKALTDAEGAAFVSNSSQSLGALYNQEMKAGSEIFLGAADGDAQVCHGDSGGPLLVNVGGELVIQGVLSALPFAGARLSCQNGAIYELPTTAPAVALIKASVNDPCADIPAAGRCDGDVTVRCTRADEGPRRVVKTDCSAILQHCAAPNSGDAGVDAGGDAGAVTEVACVD